MDIDEFYENSLDKVDEIPNPYRNICKGIISCSDAIGALGEIIYKDIYKCGLKDKKKYCVDFLKSKDCACIGSKAYTNEHIIIDEEESFLKDLGGFIGGYLVGIPFVGLSPLTAILDGINGYQRNKKYRNKIITNES